MPKAGRGQLEDPKGRAGSCPEQLSPLSTFCQGTAWPQAPRGPERSRCQPPPAPPGHLSHKPNYGLSTAVRSLIERPWGEGTAETVKYPEGDTAVPSQKQNMATPLSPAHARVKGVPGGRRNHWQLLIKSHPPLSLLTVTALSIHHPLLLFKSQAVSPPC